MDKANSERSFYPYVVVGMIIGCVIACGYTVKIATDNPVEMDTYYMEKYQKVENNFNEIMELQGKFDAKFNLAYSTEKFQIGQNSITLTLSDKSGEPVNNAHVTMLLSRPDSNKENQEFTLTKAENGHYTFGPFEITKPGRWQILSKIDVGEYKGFHKTEAYAAQ